MWFENEISSLVSRKMFSLFSWNKKSHEFWNNSWNFYIFTYIVCMCGCCNIYIEKHPYTQTISTHLHLNTNLSSKHNALSICICISVSISKFCNIRNSVFYLYYTKYMPSFPIYACILICKTLESKVLLSEIRKKK